MSATPAPLDVAQAGSASAGLSISPLQAERNCEPPLILRVFLPVASISIDQRTDFLRTDYRLRSTPLITTTEASLDRVEKTLDEYLRLDLGGIFIHPLPPYGFAIKTRAIRKYNSTGAWPARGAD